ncbi:AraC family transcriptional regulator [Cucumibacter marinus]|uniref:AraC family transcriptional regulator n=1 Tax=Cucumibacter marinus TaxID=1121252 RepID=UPI0004146311|nr:AraC family transcriptional regulator [Cucumibacter marinus]
MDTTDLEPLSGIGPDFAPLAHELFGDLFLAFLDPGEANAELRSIMLGECRLSRLDAPAHTVSRSSTKAERSLPAMPIKYIVPVSGTASFRQGRFAAALIPGMALLFDPHQAHSINCDAAVSHYVLQIPRHRFAPLPFWATGMPLVVPNAAHGPARIVGELIRSAMAETADLNRQARAQIGSTLARLCAGLAGAAPEVVTSDPRTHALARMRSYIDTHLDNAELDVDLIAAHIGCSRRYVFRAFASIGTTPARYIWDCRLDRALAALGDPANQSKSISAVAFACGFSSSAHFSRAFRKRFGQTPRQLKSF